MVELEKEKKIKFIVGQLSAIRGTKQKSLEIDYKNNEEKDSIVVDFLLPFYGLKMELGPIANWGLNLYENQIVVDTEKFETSESKIFAIGDINTYPGKLKLILSGFHEGALMAQQCFRYCNSYSKYFF